MKTHTIGFEFFIPHTTYVVAGETGLGSSSGELETFAYTLITVCVEKHGGVVVHLNARFLEWDSSNPSHAASYFMCAIVIRCNDDKLLAIKAELGIDE